MRRRLRVWPGFALAMTIAALVLRAEEHVGPSTEPTTSQPTERLPTDPGEVAIGAKLFATMCASCHGPGGEGGKGPTLAQPKLARASDEQSLLKIVKEGISGTEMPRTRFNVGDAARV